MHLSAAELRSDLVLETAPTGDFVARYTIRGAWTGLLDCDAPERGVGLPADDGPAIGPTPDDRPADPPKKGGCNGCALGGPLAAALVAARRRNRR